MNKYVCYHTADCPNGDLKDQYKITVESNVMLQVEHLVGVLEQAPKKIYQEILSDYLRNQLGAKVTVEGHHYGVKVVCTREL